MKRLLLAPLFLTLLFGCSNTNEIIRNKNDIINLECVLNEVSNDSENYNYDENRNIEYEITLDTKNKEGTWRIVTWDNPPKEFENVVITSKFIYLQRTRGINDTWGLPYFLPDYSYTINRANGEIIQKLVLTYFDKNYKRIPYEIDREWLKGICIVSEDAETLF